MCDRSQDDHLETDERADYSLMNSRLNSFCGSRLALQVPPERLARAGFYFTGNGDKVRCFSCQKTVENWYTGDTPIERHKQVSPSCTFLSCTHPTNCNRSYHSPSTNGSIYNEAAEDMEYQLRTGAVVDQTPYPMTPNMASEETRFDSFSSWPLNSPVRPRDLAQAGLYYLGQSDQVQCFCCGGKLNGWEVGDNAWDEHAKHFPNCYYVLGHDIGNIPLPEDAEEDAEESSSSQCSQPTSVQMGSFEERLRSFGNVHHPVDHERLARAGFYSTGTGDWVSCFSCGGGLKGWQPEEDPWEEHAKYYPGCSFLLAEKGQEFVNSIQLNRPQQNSVTPQQNGFSSARNDILQSPVALKAIEMGFECSMVEKTILKKISSTGSGYSNVEALVEDCFDSTAESKSTNTEQQNEDPLEKLRKLQMEKQCKICMDRDIGIVFIPCGHLVCCKECSESLIKCPICCGAITQKIKTYNA
ncbi:E3 ubiquitin-protein ligase XIAP [Xenentodon cancila]